MKRTRTLPAATLAVTLVSLQAGALLAQTTAPAPTPPEPPPSVPLPAPGPSMPPPTPAAPEAMPPPTAATPPIPAPDAVPPPALAPETLVRSPSYPRPTDLSYGVAVRFRWVSVPAFMLNVFTRKNVPLGFGALPGAWALELFRRKDNFDIGISVGYQDMSPADGNWLGTGKKADVDTDFVQFRSFGFVNIDVSFVWHAMFTDWIGMHYGAGLGVGVKHGDILRTSNYGGTPPGLQSTQCTDSNFGDLTQCHPLHVSCTATSCNEQQLAQTQITPGKDDPGDPHRFSEGSVPGAIPIINAVIGIDFRVPSLR
ncbi:MAG TPA: hypothetical protein VMU50_12225, partial [Polyangia bacterium]|nr:hypothetical protein [Polyangia bacterium]